jgi:predicted DNA-binding protein
MAKDTTSVRLPEELLEALDRRAAALGLSRSQLIVQAVEQALEEYSAWSPKFLEAIGTRRPDLDEPAEEMISAIRARRSRNEAPGL